MSEFKFIGEARSGTWRATHKKAFEEGVQLFLSGKNIPEVIKAVGMPRTTAQRLMARIRMWNNEQAKISAESKKRYVLHAALEIFPRATGSFVWVDQKREGF